MAQPEINVNVAKKRGKFMDFLIKCGQQWALLVMTIPFLIWLFIFKYYPLWGWTMAFQKYKPAVKSFSDQQWVGLEQFVKLFSDDRFLMVMRNTLAMSLINLILGFGTAIILALMLNEVRHLMFKKVVQTISYLPHFISWVVAAGIVQNMLSPDGIVNELLMKSGIINETILFWGVGEYFWGLLGATNVWKDVGWNTIIYLAAMTMIDPAQYEAAEIDGAGRLQRMWHITLPGIKSVVVVLLIMNIGYLLESGFEPQYLLGNSMNLKYSENLDIFVLRYGINMMNFSFATAAGMFKTVVSFILLAIANTVAKRAGEARLY